MALVTRLPGPVYAGAFVRHYDADGNVVWTRFVGLGSAQDVSSDGSGAYVAGYICAYDYCNGGTGEDRAFLSRYDADGNVVWTRTFGSVGLDNDSRASGVSSDASGAYVAGTTFASLGVKIDPSPLFNYPVIGFLRRYDADGNVVWTRYLSSNPRRALLNVSRVC